MLLVKAVKNTFDSKEDLKDNGFVWDRENKVWTKEFASEEEYDEFMKHFMNVTYYGRKVVNKFHSQVVFEVEEIIEEDENSNEDDVKTYDVVFNDSNDSNSKNIHGTIEECMNWIEFNRNDNSTYFGDYKGGTVSVVCDQTDEVIYEEEI